MKKYAKLTITSILLCAIALLTCSCAGLGIGSNGSKRPIYYLDVDTTDDPSAAEIVANNVIPSCVQLYAQTKEGATTSTSSGAGFFINDQGYLLTNRHCVASTRVNSLGETTWYLPSNTTYTVVCADGAQSQAHVVYYSSKDDQYDLAVLKLNGIMTNAEYLKFADLAYSKTADKYPDKQMLRYGQRVYTVGNPDSMGLLFSDATIASPEYYGKNTAGETVGLPYVLLNGFINHGNSGGPLIGGDNGVVGIVYARMENKDDNLYGIGCALPAYVIAKFLDEANVRYSYAPEKEPAKQAA